MQSTKVKSQIQLEKRQFRVALSCDVELVYAHAESAIWACDALSSDGEVYNLYIAPELLNKRIELFRGGHRLVLEATTDNFSPILYVTDAWFDRDCRHGR